MVTRPCFSGCLYCRFSTTISSWTVALVHRFLQTKSCARVFKKPRRYFLGHKWTHNPMPPTQDRFASFLGGGGSWNFSPAASALIRRLFQASHFSHSSSRPSDNPRWYRFLKNSSATMKPISVSTKLIAVTGRTNQPIPARWRRTSPFRCRQFVETISKLMAPFEIICFWRQLTRRWPPPS